MPEATVLMWVPEIEGASLLVGPDSGDENHQGWILVESCSFSFSRESTAVDSTADDSEEPAEPSTRVAPLVVKRRADNSTAKLLMWLAHPEEGGRKKEKVVIDYCHRSGRYFLRYELHGVEIVSSSISFTHPDELMETITLTFDHITILQRPIGIQGQVDLGKETMAEYTVFDAE